MALTRPRKQEVLDPEPLVGGVAGLDTVSTTVLEAGPVKLAPLPAPLLEEAPDSGPRGFSVLRLPWATWSRQSSITAAI